MQQSNCTSCGKNRTTKSRWSKYFSTHPLCKSCAKKDASENTFSEKKQKKKIYNAEYRKNNKDKLALYNKNHLREQRQEVLNHYGGICACCGESRYEFLAIDHINGGGNKHRLELGMANKNGNRNSGAGIHFTRWLIKNNYPEGFRVLCHNCNSSIGYYGYCPHHPELH